MGAVAGANEAEQTLRGSEQTPPKPEMANEQVSQPLAEQAPDQAPQAPGFGERGRMRRRARFLRKARELAYRDLGGLVFDLHRFGQRNDQLVLAKLATLAQIDRELRQLEEALRDRRPVTVLREVGIAACPRCAAIHGSDDRFCPGCGLAFDAHADRPISTAPVGAQAQPATAPAPASPPAVPAPASPLGSPGTARPPAHTPASTPTSDRPAARASAPARTPETASPPQAKPGATQVAAKPASPTPSPTATPEQRKPERADEDEPTQILRPPATGA
jgi:hypothetical protein